MTSHPEPTKMLSEKIKAAALTLGFSKVGILSPVSFGDFTPDMHLRNWLHQGYHGEMQWMETHFEKRCDPTSLMENTQSIVCVALNYHQPMPPSTSGLKIAQYALGEDYHRVVKRKLKTLLKTIQGWQSGVEGRALTDSAPIMEKPLAVQAGLGWIGKNGNLITREQGSWLFLGELLLNIPLVSDQNRVEDACGRCTRCIEACPTQAIVNPGVIDSERCISYWTIEYRGDAFPKAIEEKLSGWMYGCDICQEVCPWNKRFATPTQEEAFLAPSWHQQLDPGELLILDEQRFQERYRHSPIKRTRLSGLQRNVQAALPTSSGLSSNY